MSALFNEKTKAIIFNNPNNPLGKVYQREEIEMIAELCKKHNVLIISDDVYEHMVSISFYYYFMYNWLLYSIKIFTYSPKSSIN